MTIIVFLVDTSASMNQRTYMGTTLLDVTKGAVETFMKVSLSCFVISIDNPNTVFRLLVKFKRNDLTSVRLFKFEI